MLLLADICHPASEPGLVGETPLGVVADPRQGEAVSTKAEASLGLAEMLLLLLKDLHCRCAWYQEQSNTLML